MLHKLNDAGNTMIGVEDHNHDPNVRVSVVNKTREIFDEELPKLERAMMEYLTFHNL